MASSSQGQLSKGDLATIQNYLAKIKHKWIDIGVQLELDPEYLEELSTKRNLSDGDNIRRIILKWLTRNCPVPKWQVLCEALRTPAVDEVGIAERIEKEKIMLIEHSYEKEDSSSMTKISISEIPISEIPPASTGVPMEKDDISLTSDSVLAENIGHDIHDGPENTGSEIHDGSSVMVAVREPFPFLSTSGLSSKEKDDLLGKLIQESMEIRFKFSSLVNELEMSLLRGNIDIDIIRDEMKYFGCRDHDAIAAISDVSGAVGAMNESWNFCEFNLLENVLEKFGSGEDRAKLKSYKENLAEFSQRKVNECPEGVFGGSTKEDEVVLTVKKNYTNHDVTLSDVQNLCRKLRKEISIEDCNMRLICTGMENQSLVLTFGIASFVLQIVSSLLEDHREKLILHGIWYASCGEKVFTTKEESDNDDEDGGNADYIDGSPTKMEGKERATGLVHTDPETLKLNIHNKVEYKDEDIGTNTSVAISSQNVVVEVSKSLTSSYKSYKIGRYKRGELEWLSGLTGNRYGMGTAPKIALSNKYEGYVVEVDEEQDGNLSCRVGIVHYSNAMLWTESCVFTTGSSPSIALYQNTVITTFRRSGDAVYKIGTLDANNRSIVWSTEERKFINGVSEVAVAVNHNCIVVAVYTKPLVTSTISPLYAIVGALNRHEGKILFSSVRILSQSFALGSSPSLALNRENDVLVLSTLKKSVIQKKIEYSLGLIKKEDKTNAYDIEWSSPKGTLDGGGDQASVAISDKGVVIISHVSKGKYACHIGKLCYETEI